MPGASEWEMQKLYHVPRVGELVFVEGKMYVVADVAHKLEGKDQGTYVFLKHDDRKGKGTDIARPMGRALELGS